MKWWFIQWILMTMWWWSLWFWGNLFWDDGYTLLRASTVPTTVGPLVPRDVSMTSRFIWNWLMIRTSGGTLMKGTWNWGCLFDLVCLPARTKIWYIYIYIHYIYYIYTHIWEIIYDIYIYIYGVSECIWALSPYVLCQVCIHQVLTSQGADQRRAQLQTGEVPIALLHQHGMMVAFSPVLGAWWLSKKHEKTTVVRCMRVLVECGAYESILRISMSIIVMTAMLFVLCGCAVVFQVCIVYGGCMFIHLVWV